jgi:hypothetical protein
MVATMRQEPASLLQRHFHIRRCTFVYIFHGGPR